MLPSAGPRKLGGAGTGDFHRAAEREIGGASENGGWQG